MIDTLINKKEEISGLASNQTFYLITTMILALLFVAYVFLFLPFSLGENILLAAATFITNPLHLIYLAIIGYCYYKQMGFKAQKDKNEKSLENLRLDMIDHLKNTWYINQRSAICDDISKNLEEYGINVRYKSK